MLRAIELHRSETIMSYVSRLAAANGVSTTESLLQQMGTSSHHLWHGYKMAINAVAQHVDRPVDEVLDASFQPVTTGIVAVRGHRLERRKFWAGTPRYCPLCVLEDAERRPGPYKARPFGRLSWAIEEHRTCHVHDIKLVSARMGSHSMRHEFYNAVSADMQTVSFHAARSAQVRSHAADLYFSARLDGRTSGNDWLDAIPYHIATAVAERIGALIVHGTNKGFDRLSLEDSLNARRTGFDVLAAGPSGLQAFARYWIRQRWRQNFRHTGATIFGGLYRYLSHSLSDPGTKTIADVLRSVALETLPLNGQNSFLGARGDGRIDTVLGVSKRYRIPYQRVWTILKEEGIADDTDVAKSSTVFKFEVTPLKSRFESEAGGMSLLRLIKSYKLEPFLKSLIFDPDWPHSLRAVAIANSFRRRHFRVIEVDALLDRLTARATGENGAGLSLLPFAGVKAGCTLNEVITLLADGRLVEVAYRPRDKFQGILVSPEEIRNCLKSAGAGRSPP